VVSNALLENVQIGIDFPIDPRDQHRSRNLILVDCAEEGRDVCSFNRVVYYEYRSTYWAITYQN